MPLESKKSKSKKCQDCPARSSFTDHFCKSDFGKRPVLYTNVFRKFEMRGDILIREMRGDILIRERWGYFHGAVMQ